MPAPQWLGFQRVNFWGDTVSPLQILQTPFRSPGAGSSISQLIGMLTAGGSQLQPLRRSATSHWDLPHPVLHFFPGGQLSPTMASAEMHICSPSPSVWDNSESLSQLWRSCRSVEAPTVTVSRSASSFAHVWLSHFLGCVFPKYSPVNL